MAWQCSGRTNKELIENLYKHKLITNVNVRDAMMRVDRAHYCPLVHPSSQPNPQAYHDTPLPIGHSATISAPHMHASAVESLLPFISKPGARVLDIGSGSGYLSGVLGEMIAEESSRGGRGSVVALEHIKELRDLGEENMRRSERGRRMLEGEGGVKVEFVMGDGRKGWKLEDEVGGFKSWDAIHVGAAASELHSELVDQLGRPGRMFIPISDASGAQNIWTVDKDLEGKIKRTKLYGVRYVPLTDAPK